jgi:predicted metalloendopeptidase
MSKPMTVEQMTTILGHRPSQTEREAFYAGHDPGRVVSNNRPAPNNVYAHTLANLNPHSNDPAERRRYARFQRLAQAREADLTESREKQKTRTLMGLDEDIQKARDLYTECVNTYRTETTEDVADKGAALAALERALDGDKNGGLDAFYAAAGRIADRKLQASSEVLAEARTVDEDTHLQRARLEADAAGMRATKIKVDHGRRDPS